MVEGSPTPCGKWYVQNGSEPVFQSSVISDNHVKCFIMILGVILVSCSLAVYRLSDHSIGSHRGARILRQLVGLGDLFCGAVILLVLLYTYWPDYYSTSNTEPTGTCYMDFQSQNLVLASRSPLTLLLVAFARQIHIDLVYNKNLKDLSVRSAIRIFLPAIIGISIEGTHIIFTTVYPKTAHRLITSFPWPSICVWSKTTEVFYGTIMGIMFVGITVIILGYVVFDFMGVFQKSRVSPTGYTEVVEGPYVPNVDMKEIYSNEKSCDENSKDCFLLGSDYGKVTSSTLNLVQTKDVALPISNVQVKHTNSDDICPAVRMSIIVSLNAFILTIPLIISMTIALFDDGHPKCLTFILMLLRWTFLSACNVFTCLYYSYITPKK